MAKGEGKARRRWADYATTEFAAVDPERTVAVLPVAAIEQHGPHLPVGTDAIINEGLLDLALDRAPSALDLRVLPHQAIGKSNEHLYAPGTLTLPAPLLIEVWTELGLAVARAGIRKLVVLNAHGGNEEVMAIVTRELRVRAGMLAVKTSWGRFGRPDGLVSDLESRHGIHGGEVETALMLHLAPHLVDMEKAEHFRSVAERDEARFSLLRPTGTHAWAWIASDLNPAGVVGNAAAATAETGRRIALHQVDGFLRLLGEVAEAPLPGG